MFPQNTNFSPPSVLQGLTCESWQQLLNAFHLCSSSSAEEVKAQLSLLPKSCQHQIYGLVCDLTQKSQTEKLEEWQDTHAFEDLLKLKEVIQGVAFNTLGSLGGEQLQFVTNRYTCLLEVSCTQGHIFTEADKAEALFKSFIAWGAPPPSITAPLAEKIEQCMPQTPPNDTEQNVLGTLSLDVNCRQDFISTVPLEMWPGHIFPNLDLASRLSCCYVTKFLHQHYFRLVRTEVLKICPFSQIDTGRGEVFSIDAYDLGLKLIKIGPEIEGNVGMTLLTMRKGVTLSGLMQIPRDSEIPVRLHPTVSIDLPSLKKLGDVPIEKTERILITNSLFRKTRNKALGGQQQIVIANGCRMQTVQELFALCVFGNKEMGKSHYFSSGWAGTFGRTSLLIAGSSLAIGWAFCENVFSLLIPNYDFDNTVCGAGGALTWYDPSQDVSENSVEKKSSP